MKITAMPENNKIRVIGFDGWTQGAHHYARLVEAFDDHGIDLFLVHIGSFGDDSNRATEEIINGLLVRDIAFYKTNSFFELLRIENPDVVILLSTETFLHRALLRYCRQLQIPTLHLFHGLVNVVPFVSKDKVFRFDFFNSLSYRVDRAGKFFNYTLPLYIKSMIDTHANLQDWGLLFRDIIYRAFNKLIINPAPDSATDRYCVYTAADFEIVFSKWKCATADVVAIGNPDLIAIETYSDVGALPLVDVSPFVIYIDSHITHQGLFFNNEEQYLEFIDGISRYFKKHDVLFKFKVKPHPMDRAQFIVDALERKGIETLSNEEFSALLPGALGVITEPSTLALVACILGKDLLLVKLGPLAKTKYGDMLENYPNARHIHTFDDLGAFLTMGAQEDSGLKSDAMNDWLQMNAGPLPASDMPKRVAEVVQELARTRRAQSCV